MFIGNTTKLKCWHKPINWGDIKMLACPQEILQKINLDTRKENQKYRKTHKYPEIVPTIELNAQRQKLRHAG